MWFGLIAVSIILLVVMLTRGQQGVSRRVKEAVAAKEITPLVTAAAALPTGQQPAFFLEAIETLWNGWQRELAAHLIHHFVQHHPEEKLAQYWVRQVLEIEPEIADEIMQEDFLATHYQPGIAAGCGAVG